MARYTGASCRLCRREGEKLYLKGERCTTNKCAIARRGYAPGQHGQNKKKLSEYGLSFVKNRKQEDTMEFLKASSEGTLKWLLKRKGITGENLLQILESRLDNVVYRMVLRFQDVRQDSW